MVRVLRIHPTYIHQNRHYNESDQPLLRVIHFASTSQVLPIGATLLQAFQRNRIRQGWAERMMSLTPSRKQGVQIGSTFDLLERNVDNGTKRYDLQGPGKGMLSAASKRTDSSEMAGGVCDARHEELRT